jgi:tRNA-2-methylthio-N6-dimethylallyladenosine synthase
MMNRGYTREWYEDRMAAINRIIPGCGISTDFIIGFCSETEEDHQLTISLMEKIQFDYAYMFSYSERPKTLAERKYADDVPEAVKSRRLAEIVELQRKNSGIKTALGIGKVHEVLIEGFSKKSQDFLMGRNPQNTVVVFPKGNHKKGDYVNVLVTKCTTSTLIGEVV